MPSLLGDCQHPNLHLSQAASYMLGMPASGDLLCLPEEDFQHSILHFCSSHCRINICNSWVDNNFHGIVTRIFSTLLNFIKRIHPFTSPSGWKLPRVSRVLQRFWEAQICREESREAWRSLRREEKYWNVKQAKCSNTDQLDICHSTILKIYVI